MPPKFNFPEKEIRMANRFLSAKVAKKVSFMNSEIEISKLTVQKVLAIQDKAKEITEGDEKANIDVLLFVIKAGAAELSDLSQDELQGFPMDELSNLSSEILKYSGLVPNAKKS